MKLATTTGDFSKFGLNWEEKIQALYRAGFRHIDFNLYNENTMQSPFMQEDWKEYTKKISEFAQSLGMDFVQAHLPNVNPLRFDESWETAVAVTVRGIEVCEMLHIPNAVIHSGWAPGLGKQEYFEKNMPFFSRLFPYMDRCNVNVCIENSTKANMGEMYFFFTGEDMLEFIQYVGHPKLKACWDTGHANIEGHQYSDIMALGEYLTAVHIHDNCGKKDEHILPFTGSLSLDEVMHGLIDSGYQGVFTFEVDSAVTFSDHWLLKRNRFREEKRLLEPPLFLREHMEKTMYDLGVYILKSYDCLEES